MAQTPSVETLLTDFCQQQALPEHYGVLAKRYFLPLAEELVEKLVETKAATDHALILGINGCQGSGKSTLAALLSTLLGEHYGLNVANLSIDDFYLTKNERTHLARTKHPLFVTRGVPGTHDIHLLNQTLHSLQYEQKQVFIPRFDKAIDDRADEKAWDSLIAPADVIILEGWCVGVSAQDDDELEVAINPLEQTEDEQGLWRKSINNAIVEQYEDLFAKLDVLVMLKAPSFDSVYQWRTKQEDKLRQKLLASGTSTEGLMDKSSLERFIHHYQRLTEHMLSVLPQQAHMVFELDEHHRISGRKDNGKS